MKHLLKILTTTLTLSLVFQACGGGGGNDSESYAGTWSFSGNKVHETCDSGAPSTASVTLTVNQDGDRVVVNSGSITLVGTTNDQDGFGVVGSGTTTNGCSTEYAYYFDGASDGDADVGLAIVANCGGARCEVGYGGSASKRNDRVAYASQDTQLDPKDLADLLADRTYSMAPEFRSYNDGEDAPTIAESILEQ